MARRLPAAALFAFLLAPVLSLAAGGGGEGAENNGPLLVNLFYRFVNFAILIGGLVFVARKFKLLPLLAGSVEAVRKSLEETEAAEREARSRLAEAEARMGRLTREVEQMVALARDEAERERQAILQDAGREVEKIRREAQVALEQELKKVQEELKAEMAASVVEIAGEILRRDVRAEDQKRFVRDYLNQLEGMPR